MFKILIFIGIVSFCGQLVSAQNFQADCLKAHNKYRKLHGVPDLVNDSKVTKVAQEWANKLVAIDKLEHRPENPYGENLYAKYGSIEVTCSEVVKTWYDEIKNYNYNKPGFTAQTGHFTQVVWKNSKKLGCGAASKGNRIYVVCNYDPSGNYIGAFKENVLKPRK